ncbi:DJ-1/PfpI family protein [Maridesulfovibrio salexigens]|uniref:ThiJ/PfpI domain protein n=1 Tax=Maridesulfovibrio salexigens (strain ATCC 14822 / DSM 2638 / NCIMB 8403 / VKM B-1763) TaxID=526222 RepID=C6BWR1_MARSD|nr:DJ-1/PfpI family protein [Maridesulfovibrio salexigens]ACS80341.1 ThiJ/PfpI domain protein [Maridesulfovibrio salexigens DSM 2638]
MRKLQKGLTLLVVMMLVIGMAASSMAGTHGKKAIMIVAKSDFEQTEYKKTRAALDDAGVVCSIASTKVGTLKGNKGKRIESSMLLKDVNVADYDAVVFIGGNGIKKVWKNENAHKIAQEAVKQDKILAAICAAPGILGYAGVLEGKQATAHPKSGARKVMTKNGCNFQSEKVVVDGKIITANGPKAAGKFGKTIVEALN